MSDVSSYDSGESEEPVNLLDLKLIQAVKAGHINTVRKALREGANIHADKEAALRTALNSNNRSIYRLLIAEGADPKGLLGFHRPVRVSDTLADFLGKIAGFDVVRGDLLNRTQVTKYLGEYIVEKELSDPEHRGRIRYQTDPDLAKIIKLPDGMDLTYFNLQSAIRHHFVLGKCYPMFD